MAIYNREDPRTALPQLEKQLNARIDGLLDFFYPVGCYFETSDTEFNPNKAWGGKWELETEGMVHIGAGDNYTAGDSGGTTTHAHTTGNHTLTVNEIPPHNHRINWMNYSRNTGSNETMGYLIVTETSNYNTTMNTGGGQAHNHGNTGEGSNMPPYIVVNRWHRVA